MEKVEKKRCKIRGRRKSGESRRRGRWRRDKDKVVEEEEEKNPN